MSLNFQEWSRDHRVEVKENLPSIPMWYGDAQEGWWSIYLLQNALNGHVGLLPCEEERNIKSKSNLYISLSYWHIALVMSTVANYYRLGSLNNKWLCLTFLEAAKCKIKALVVVSDEDPLLGS